MKTWLSTLCLALVWFAGGAASAATLPMVVDATQDPATFWWAEEGTVAASPFDELLFAAAEAGGSDVVSPRAVSPDGTISRIYRTADISPNNARNFAGLYGADRVLLGSVVSEPGTSVGWLALARTRSVIDARLVDASSGAVIHSFRLSADGIHADPAEALAASLAALARDTLRVVETYQPGSGAVGDGSVDPVVVVLGAEGDAAPYVAFRTALRDSHPSVIEIAEAWATEGRIALRVDLDEGGEFDQVVGVLAGWVGSTIGDVRIIAVEPHELGVFVQISTPPGAGDSNTPN